MTPRQAPDVVGPPALQHRTDCFEQQSASLTVFPLKPLQLPTEEFVKDKASTLHQQPGSGPGPPQAKGDMSAFVDKTATPLLDSSSEDGDTLRLYCPVPGTAGTQCSTQTLSSFQPMQLMASNSLSRLQSSRSEATAQGMPATTFNTPAAPADTTATDAQLPVTSATPSDSAAAQDTHMPSWHRESGSGDAQDASVHLTRPPTDGTEASVPMTDAPAACPSEPVKEASADDKQESQEASVQQPAAAAWPHGSAVSLPEKMQQEGGTGNQGLSKDASESEDVPSEEGRGPAADTHGRDASGSGQGGLQGFRAYVNPHAKPEALNLPCFNRSGTTGSSVAANSTAANLSAELWTKQSAGFGSLGTDENSRSTWESSEAVGGDGVLVEPQAAINHRKDKDGSGGVRKAVMPNLPETAKEVAGEGMQPFWMQSNAQASANEQAEMAAFCRAYAQTAAAAKRDTGSQSMEDACMQDLQRRHMIMALQSHVMFQQQLMMQHHMMMGMFPGGNGPPANSQQQQPTPPGWPQPMPQLWGHPASSEHMPSSSFMPSGGLPHSARSPFTMPGTSGPPWPTDTPAGSEQQQGQQQTPSAAGGGADAAGKSGTPIAQQERRALALNKYKQKRKNLCFTKKIRYESRKQLAKARPRVKGQFVRRSSLGLTEGDGISDLLEPVADAAAHEAAREAAEAVMSLAHGKMDVAPEAEEDGSYYEDGEADGSPVQASPRPYLRRGQLT